jgi:hypothetical protein
MRILNDHEGEVNGTISLSRWEADLICEALIGLIGDIPEGHDDLEVASELHKSMNAFYNLLEDNQ